jgi:hypothetical protein
MPITPERKTRLETRTANKEAMLQKLYDASENWDNTKSYTFDSGEGRQGTTYHSLGEVEQAIRRLESQIDRLTRIINGHGVVNLNLRRM